MARLPKDPIPIRQARVRAARRRFREIFPGGFADATYLDWERGYKWAAHRQWQRVLGRAEWRRLLEAGAHAEVARRVSTFYARSKLNMLALYEWMALREALESERGARLLAPGLFELIHGGGPIGERVDRFTALLDEVPQRQTRLAKWPVVTLFPFVAQPRRHMILKPNLMKRAAARLGFELDYRPRPNGETYRALLSYVDWLREELRPWRPRDLIDVQGFLWVTQSDEYADWPWE
jgi:hypothetical protein